MANINVAVLGSLAYSEGMGKKGTSTDITFYNLKKGQDTVTFIEPSRYPERLSSLFFATSISRSAILVVDALDPAFGETVLMLNCLGIGKGYLVPRNLLSADKLQPLVKGTVVESYELAKEDKNWLRERLLAEVESAIQPSPSAVSGGSVVVDHSFNVKGVGTVVLGTVINGSLGVHDTLKALPVDKSAIIRSIQKHDDNFETASKGDRVGLALKDIGVDDVERGAVLTTESTLKSASSLGAQVELVKYWNSPLKQGMVLHIGHWMQFLPSRIVNMEEKGNEGRQNLNLELNLEKPLVYSPGDRAVLSYLEGGKLRVVGSFTLS